MKQFHAVASDFVLPTQFLFLPLPPVLFPLSNTLHPPYLGLLTFLQEAQAVRATLQLRLRAVKRVA